MSKPEVGDLHRAEIWYVHGTEKNTKQRPVVLIEIDETNGRVIALSITGSNRVQHPKGSDISLMPDTYNRLTKPSVVDTTDITLIKFENLKSRYGKLSPKDLDRITVAYMLFGKRS